MVVVDCQLFSIVEDEGFVKLVKELQPRYQIPSRRTTTLIPQMFEKCKETVQRIIQLQDFVALTTDIWSSRGHDSVISLQPTL